MEHGTDLRKLAWTGAPRRLWRKVWAEPLHRLPTRVYRKVRHGVAALLS
jgi:hypothetical protein